MYSLRIGRFPSIVLVVAALVLPVATAHSQKAAPAIVLPAPVVAVIDFKRAVEESLAGKGIIKQINARHKRIQKEIAKDTADLEAVKQELERQRTVLSADVYKQKRREFQFRVQRYRRDIQTEQRKLDLMLGQSILKVEAKLAKILRDMAHEMGANLVVDAGPGRGNVLFSDSKLVITAQATARLNKVLPEVKVVEPVSNAKSAPQTPRLQVPKVQ